MRLLLLTLAACAANAQSFNDDLQPVFRKYCYGCHAASVKMGSLDVETHEGLMRGGNQGPIIVPGKADQSRLYLMVAGKLKPSMPMDGTTLAAGELDIIKNWIDKGAKAEVVKKATNTRPDVKPRVALKPQIYSLAWSADGSILAEGGYQQVRLLDGAGTQTATLDGHLESVRAVAISKDGKRLAAAGGLPGQKGEVKIWDLATKQVVATINGHKDCIYAVAFSPDGKTVATASYDKLIYLWDAQTGQLVKTLKDHIDAIYALAFSPDGTRLLSAGADRTLKVWNTQTGERLFTMSESTDCLNAIALSPDGKQVAGVGTDKTIRIWTLAEKSGELRTSLIAHEDAILKVAWSPDGKLLATASADRTIKLFQASDLAEIKTITGQPDWVNGLLFSPDGRRLAAARLDGTLEFYPIPR